MSFGRKFLYSLANMSAAVSGQAVGAWLLYFYVDTVKLPVTLYGLGMVLYSVWNALNDPLAGHISDRTRTRWGRRIPYIAILSLPLAVSFALVWTPPAGLGGWALFAYFIGILFIFDTLFTFVILNSTALFPEMYPSLRERAQVSALRQIVAIVGLVMAMALPPVLYTSLGWPLTGTILAVVIGLGLYLSLLGSRERPEARGGEALALGPALRNTFANRSFVTFVFGSLFAQFTFVVLPASMPLFVKYVLRVPDSQMTLVFLSVFGSAFIMLFAWQKVTTAIGARQAMRLSLVLFALGLIPFMFITSLTAMLVTGALVGVGLAGLMMLIDVLISDVIDEDQLKTGTRREGMYFGVHGFVIRLGIALQGVVMSAVLEWGGYIPDVVQSPQAVLAIRMLMTIVPWVALALSFIAITLYPLHGRRLARVKEEIARLAAGTGTSAG